MFHKILKNEQGMSMVEVVVASAVAIIISMGVVQINQNASNSMSVATAKQNLKDYQRLIQRDLSDRAYCTQVFTQSGATNISSNQTPSILRDGTGSSARVFANEGATLGNWGAPEIRIIDIRISSFVRRNDHVGSCNIEIDYENTKISSSNSTTAQRNAKRRTLRIPVNCRTTTSTGTTFESCSTVSDGKSDGWFTENDANQSIKYEGAGGVTRVEIGDTTTTSTIDGALNVGDSGSVFGSGQATGQNIAMKLIPNSGVIFGNEGANQVVLYDDTDATTGAPGHLYLDAEGFVMEKAGASIFVNGDMVAASSVYSPEIRANNFYYSSDERYKEDIEQIENASERLSELRGVTYFLRRDEFPHMNFSTDRQYGLIAQEVEAVYPELVKTGKDGYKSVEYANLVSVLIEAFKEEKENIKKNQEILALMQNGIETKLNDQNDKINKLESEVKDLRKEVEELKAIIRKKYNLEE